MTERHHVTCDAIEALADAVQLPVTRDPMTDTRFLKLGRVEFWARPEADHVVAVLAGKTGAR